MNQEFLAPKSNGFVLMPFAKQFNDVYHLLIKWLEEGLAIDINRADELPFDNRRVYDNIISAIGVADVIVADITGRNPNVFYEIGYAHALGKPVVPITADHPNETPFDVAGFRIIFYSRDDLSSARPLLLSSVAAALEIARSSQQREHTLLEQHSEAAKIVRAYALNKAKESAWSRPGMYFTQDELIRETTVNPELAYSVLDALRATNLLVCVNYKGESVWMGSEAMKATAGG